MCVEGKSIIKDANIIYLVLKKNESKDMCFGRQKNQLFGYLSSDLTAKPLLLPP